MNNKNIGIIGAGSFGTAVSDLISSKGIEVKIFVREEDVYNNILYKRENIDFLPKIKLNELIKPEMNLESVVSEAEIIILAVPSTFLEETLLSIKKIKSRGMVLLNLAKGLEKKRGVLLSELMEEIFPQCGICCLSGPTLAPELAYRYPSSCVVSSKNFETAREIQELLSTGYFRIYTGDDIIGVQLGGAMKNSIAIAAGICDGMGWGHNTISALITRGIVEITRMGVSYGANPQTFQGLSGIGDLIVTCMSPISRNHSLGKRLANGETLSEIVSKSRMIAEGVEITRIMKEQSIKRNIELPIINAVYQILFEDKKPSDAVYELLNRKLIDEKIELNY